MNYYKAASKVCSYIVFAKNKKEISVNLSMMYLYLVITTNRLLRKWLPSLNHAANNNEERLCRMIQTNK